MNILPIKQPLKLSQALIFWALKWPDLQGLTFAEKGQARWESNVKSPWYSDFLLLASAAGKEPKTISGIQTRFWFYISTKRAKISDRDTSGNTYSGPRRVRRAA